MKNLILPVAGKSTRYNGVRPKFLLNHPNGNFMLIESIKGLNLTFFDKIYIVCLKEHLEKYKFENGLFNQIDKVNRDKVVLTVLENQTNNQPQTVYECIIKNNIKGLITVKDCDNFFEVNLIDDNYVSYCDLNDVENINIKNKSYLETNKFNLITNIVEKNIISNKFCNGLYTFKNSKDFVKYYEKNKNMTDIYLSHIIYDMILNGINFKVEKSSNYIDWGTIDDWYKYTREFKTIFIDLDGVLVENSSEYFEPFWGTTKKIKDNVDFINELYLSGKCKIIITTSRKKSNENITKEQLKRENIFYHDIIFDLNHNKRYLINDYSDSNPFPSSISINTRRNEPDIRKMLKN